MALEAVNTRGLSSHCPSSGQRADVCCPRAKFQPQSRCSCLPAELHTANQGLGGQGWERGLASQQSAGGGAATAIGRVVKRVGFLNRKGAQGALSTWSPSLPMGPSAEPGTTGGRATRSTVESRPCCQPEGCRWPLLRPSRASPTLHVLWCPWRVIAGGLQ